jgi:glyoxylase-like metal-dependent hydrolase (beta-lactamase superfamily II)
MRVGDIEIIPVSDGPGKLPSAYMTNSDWSAHKDLLDVDGNFDIQIGCFLVRTKDKTVLIDAGLGPMEFGPFKGGQLPDRLAAVGVKPADIDLVLLTHLHIDHIGWVVRDDEPYFPNATVRFGEKDLDQFVRSDNPDFVAAPMVATLEARGLADPIRSDGEIAPGISTLHAPGHTLGHRCVVISSGDQRAFLLGDVIGCPVQIQESEWGAMSDVDPKLAKRTRETLWKEIEGTDDLVTAAHFSELQFGRILRGEGKRYFA